MVLAPAQLTPRHAVAGWLPAMDRYCALKFAPHEAIAELLVEAVTLALAGGEIRGVVQILGLLNCSGALPPDVHRWVMAALRDLKGDLPNHLARGVACLVLELYDGSLADALDGRAPACVTCQTGCFAAPVKELCACSAPVLRSAKTPVCAAQAASPLPEPSHARSMGVPVVCSAVQPPHQAWSIPPGCEASQCARVGRGGQHAIGHHRLRARAVGGQPKGQPLPGEVRPSARRTCLLDQLPTMHARTLSLLCTAGMSCSACRHILAA